MATRKHAPHPVRPHARLFALALALGAGACDHGAPTGPLGLVTDVCLCPGGSGGQCPRAPSDIAVDITDCDASSVFLDVDGQPVCRVLFTSSQPSLVDVSPSVIEVPRSVPGSPATRVLFRTALNERVTPADVPADGVVNVTGRDQATNEPFVQITVRVWGAPGTENGEHESTVAQGACPASASGEAG